MQGAEMRTVICKGQGPCDSRKPGCFTEPRLVFLVAIQRRIKVHQQHRAAQVNAVAPGELTCQKVPDGEREQQL